MKFSSIALFLLMAMSVAASDEEHEHLLRALRRGKCEEDGKNCDIKFTLAKYEPKDGDDKCILKYELKNDGKKDGKKKKYKYKGQVTFKEKDGDKIKEKDGEVVCKRKNYDGEDTVDDDGLPEKLEFGEKKVIKAKYDDEKAKAEVKGWEKGDTLKLTIKPKDGKKKCSFDNAKHCEVKFTKAKYKSGDEECTLKYKLIDKKSKEEKGDYEVVFNEDNAKIKTKDEKDKIKCIIKNYDGSADSDGDGLPKDLKFDKEDVRRAKYNGDSADAFVKGWEEDDDLVLVIKY